MKSQIRFNYADRRLNIGTKSIMKDVIKMLFVEEKRAVSKINFIFCSDDYILQINKDFLQHDYYTDIITFPLSNKGLPIEAEIYISLDRVRQNAKELKQPFLNELVRVLAHGALHLCGYRDKSKADIKLMREKEAHYINLCLKFHVKHKKQK